MRIINIFLLFTFSILIGCSDYKLSAIVEDPEEPPSGPEIEVSPVEHSFGVLSAGSESMDAVVTIKNIGNEDLNISDIYLHNSSSNFTIAAIGTDTLEPNAAVNLIVTYSPVTYEVNTNIISIISNDEDERNTEISLDGSGDAPVIYIDPEEYDLGSTFLGCDEILEVMVGNVGNSNLIISDLQYFATIPNDFTLGVYEGEYGPLPITIAPGDFIFLDIDYVPMDIISDSAYIEIDSNDPYRPVARAEHEALGEYKDWVADHHTQEGDMNVDILFVIDNSGSMGSNQINIKNNFADFINIFSAAGVDYHLALITTDDENFVGSIITNSSSDPVSDFNGQIDIIGTGGNPQEQGLWFSYLATDVGGDAASGSITGFFRADAKLVIVYVSDEPDWSVRSSSMSYLDYSNHFLSLKSTPSLVVAHSIIGDYPSGCTGNGSAQFGEGYYDVANNLGGTDMSICASNWSVTMESLARESLAGLSFSLTQLPLEETIVVHIDGVLAAGWTYDPVLNRIVFSSAPPDGSAIDIDYAIIGECEE